MLTIRIDYRRGRPTLAPGRKEGRGGGLLCRTIVLSIGLNIRGTCTSIMLFIIWEELEIFLESRLEIIERPNEIREQGFFGRRVINPETWRGEKTYPPRLGRVGDALKGDLDETIRNRGYEVVIRRLNHDPSAKFERKSWLSLIK